MFLVPNIDQMYKEMKKIVEVRNIHQKGKLLGNKVHNTPYTAIHQKGKLLVYKVHNTPYTAIHQKGKLLGNKVHNTTYTAIHQKGKVKKKIAVFPIDRPTLKKFMP
jgi:phage gpG-like protein